MAKWRIGHLNLFIIFELKIMIIDDIWTYLALKWQKMAKNGNKWQKWQKMAKWRMGHLSFFTVFELKIMIIDDTWTYLALKWRKMAKMAKNGNKWQNGRKWPKMADGSFELFYHI